MSSLNSVAVKLFLLLLLIDLASFLNIQDASSSSAPVVETKSGRVQGISQTLPDGKQVNVFLAIPFAQPPVGELRFKKPIPVERWNGIYLATRNRDSCMQNLFPDITTSEDCLFLNIWQPIKQNITKGKLSVMFWIYGGGFTSGSIFLSIYNADYLSTLGDVIVVTTNYRLGAFGFLYGGSEDAPGNVGLHDQLLALKWVKDNIASFGGNPNSITIFGESAGAMSVGAHVLSPLSNGLFQRAIIQSWTPNSITASRSKDKSIVITNNLSKSLKCENVSLEEQVRCLKNKTKEEILKAHIQIPIPYRAIYGDEFLPMKPSEAMKGGKLNQVDLIFGHTRDEATMSTINSFIDLTKDKLLITTQKARSYILSKLQAYGFPHGDKVADFYLNGLKDEDKKRLFKAVSDSIGDFDMICPTVLFGELAAKWNKNNNSYSYMLAHSYQHIIKVGKHLQDVLGVTHTDDLFYIFGKPIRDKTTSKENKQMSYDLINAWTTFAKTG